MNAGFANVALPLAVRKTLSYAIPQRLSHRVQPGIRVLVPLGPRKLVVGYVTERSDESPPVPPDLMKEIVDVLDQEAPLTPEILRLTQWASEYYLAPWGMTLKAALPSGIHISSFSRIAITDAGRAWLHAFREATSKIGKNPPAKFKLLLYLADHTPADLKSLVPRVRIKSLPAVLSQCEKAGLLRLDLIDWRPRVRDKKQWLVTALPQPINGGGGGQSLPERQKLALDRLRAAGGSETLAILQKAAGCRPATIHALAKRELVKVEKVLVGRKPPSGEPIIVRVQHELTSDQQDVLRPLYEALAAGRHERFLLHGVTGSGKTEVYLQLMAETLRRGGATLVLVPEIALTPAVSQLFQIVFGEHVALLHSGLSSGEKLDEWWRIRRGQARVVVGTRSAVFAPLQNLRLIIVDEEHDPSYKQDETPRYHARDLALKRAQIEGALIVLGSATPSLETFANAMEKQKIRYLSLPARVLGRPLAEVAVVDMTEEFRKLGRAQVISRALREQIETRLAAREQTLVLLNRRGYSRTVLCRSCGHTIYCEQCSITMTWHRVDDHLICHYCGSTREPPDTCVVCGNRFIYYLGEGTEQIQDILQKFFPGARIDRMDHDTTRRKGRFNEILARLARGETDILVGTQMIAKGHDFHNVTLVGVLAADSSLSFPDFRTAERTFQLLTQVAGRAGRGEMAGQVVLQTYYPNHYALKLACRQDYQAFYREERRFRQSMHYPPLAVLANILIKDRDPRKVVKLAKTLAEEIRTLKAEMEGGEGVRVLGPAPAPLEKLRGEYRYQILIKATERMVMRRVLEMSSENLYRAKAGMKNVTIDVDPVNIL